MHGGQIFEAIIIAIERAGRQPNGVALSSGTVARFGETIRSVATEFDAPDAETCLQQLLSKPLSKHQIEILATALTVGETYFFERNGASKFSVSG